MTVYTGMSQGILLMPKHSILLHHDNDLVFYISFNRILSYIKTKLG